MKNIDKTLFFLFVILTVFGLVMMSSISVAVSFQLKGDNDYYFWRHFVYILLGVGVFLVALFTPHRLLQKFAFFGFVVSVGLLMAVLVYGNTYGTAATSWLHVVGFSFQPVEMAKLGVILFLSTIFSSSYFDASDIRRGFFVFVLVVGIPAILIMMQPDLGSLFVLVLAATSVYILAGCRLIHFAFGAGCSAVIITLLAIFNPYVSNRFAVFLDPDLDPLGVGFQVHQAMIAIGSGGFFGRGFHNSVQKFDYLPEVQSDTIFAAIAEELGFVRIIIFIGLYLWIAFRGYRIARNAPDYFSQLLAAGVTTLIVGQAFVNIAVNLGLFPNTGITLPLISYGGTSLWATFIGFGILLHISGKLRPIKKRKNWIAFGRR